VKNFFYFIGLLVILFGISITPTFAQQESIGISIPVETNVPGCEITNLCYIPSPLTIPVGTVVEWTNQDNVVHTVASGSPQEGPNGIIYSDTMAPNEVFAFHFKEPGVYPYFCTIHPWMEGIIIVRVSNYVSDSNEYSIKEQMISSDGSTLVTIQTNEPKAKSDLKLELSFTDKNNRLLESLNYDIRIIQDDEDIFFLQNENSHDGKREHIISNLESDNPIDVEIGIRGIYLSSYDPQQVEELIKFQQIPEFGSIAMLILVMAVCVLVALRVKPIFKIPS